MRRGGWGVNTAAAQICKHCGRVGFPYAADSLSHLLGLACSVAAGGRQRACRFSPPLDVSRRRQVDGTSAA